MIPSIDSLVNYFQKTPEAWMASQGDEGMETKLKAFERMLSGNAQYKDWAKENRPKKKNEN